MQSGVLMQILVVNSGLDREIC